MCLCIQGSAGGAAAGAGGDASALHSDRVLHLGVKLKYQIPYEWEHFQTIRGSAPIRKLTIFGTFFERFSSRFESFSECFGPFSQLFWRLFGVVVVATLFSSSLSSLRLLSLSSASSSPSSFRCLYGLTAGHF